MFNKLILFFVDQLIRLIILLKWPISILFFSCSLYIGWSCFQFSSKCINQKPKSSLIYTHDSFIEKASFNWSSPAQDGGPGFLFPTYSSKSSRYSSESDCDGISKTSIFISSILFFLLSYFSFCVAMVVVKLPSISKFSLFLLKSNFIITFIFIISAPQLAESNKMPTVLYLFYAFLVSGLYWSLYKIYGILLKGSKVLVIKT